MSATSSVISSITSSSPTATRTSGGGGGGNNGGPSSPLLFFVALGFGVVFTNLWIIVGVKYCFRYNQRNRQRLNGEAADAVDMGAMPRQHRRRREKKLMSMEEVNEKFPLTKYKAWRSTRAEEGLPTAGGITTNATSRPASIRDETRDSKEVEQTIVQTTTANTENEKAAIADQDNPDQKKDDPTQSEAATASSPRPKSARSNTGPITTTITGTSTNDDEGDEDDHIQTAVPAEQLPDPGDACAICIDTIEDDDDVRGLHCGHAFHASCVDPWLTSRRACCPLCKADYYVPKPRPEGVDADGRRRGDGVNLPGQPPFAFMAGARGAQFNNRRPTMVLPGRFMTIVYDENDRYGFPRVVREPRPPRPGRRNRSAPTLSTTENGENVTQSEPTDQRDWRRRFTAVRIPNPVTTIRGWRGGEQITPPSNASNTNANPTANTTEAVTPAQLEAGRA